MEGCPAQTNQRLDPQSSSIEINCCQSTNPFHCALLIWGLSTVFLLWKVWKHLENKYISFKAMGLWHDGKRWQSGLLITNNPPPPSQFLFKTLHLRPWTDRTGFHLRAQQNTLAERVAEQLELVENGNEMLFGPAVWPFLLHDAAHVYQTRLWQTQHSRCRQKVIEAFRKRSFVLIQ